MAARSSIPLSRMWLYNSYRCCLPSWNGFCCIHSTTELSFPPWDCAVLASILRYRTFLRYYILCPLQWIYRWTFWEECPSDRHHKESLLFPNIQHLIWQCSCLQRGNSSIGNHSSSTPQIYFSYSKPVSLSFLKVIAHKETDGHRERERERERDLSLVASLNTLQVAIQCTSFTVLHPFGLLLATQHGTHEEGRCQSLAGCQKALRRRTPIFPCQRLQRMCRSSK